MLVELTLNKIASALALENPSRAFMLDSFNPKKDNDLCCPHCFVLRGDVATLYAIGKKPEQNIDEDNLRCRVCREVIVHNEIQNLKGNISFLSS
jgi:hypothetical protein